LNKDKRKFTLRAAQIRSAFQMINLPKAFTQKN